MEYIIFKKDYDKKLFYSLLGKFFAERKYKKMFPYLVNEENSTWIVAINDNEVVGFTIFEEKKTRIIFDYTYAETIPIEMDLMNRRFLLIKDIDKPIEIDLLIENSDVKYWLEKGFYIKKRTKNYIYLRKQNFSSSKINKGDKAK